MLNATNTQQHGPDLTTLVGSELPFKIAVVWIMTEQETRDARY